MENQIGQVPNGLKTPKPTKTVNGFYVVDLLADSPLVTTEDVRRLENDLPGQHRTGADGVVPGFPHC